MFHHLLLFVIIIIQNLFWSCFPSDRFQSYIGTYIDFSLYNEVVMVTMINCRLRTITIYSLLWDRALIIWLFRFWLTTLEMISIIYENLLLCLQLSYYYYYLLAYDSLLWHETVLNISQNIRKFESLWIKRFQLLYFRFCGSIVV